MKTLLDILIESLREFLSRFFCFFWYLLLNSTFPLCVFYTLVQS